jgi:hypothetical protein
MADLYFLDLAVHMAVENIPWPSQKSQSNVAPESYEDPRFMICQRKNNFLVELGSHQGSPPPPPPSMVSFCGILIPDTYTTAWCYTSEVIEI